MGIDSGFILHRYAYRETSWLFKIFSARQGLVSAIGKGARTNKKSQHLCQAFTPLHFSLRGNHEPQYLSQVEPMGSAYHLSGEALFCGFYVNEILLKFLTPHLPHPELFLAYEHLLKKMVQHFHEADLREFEIHLLREWGIFPDLQTDENNAAIRHDAYYQLLPGSLPKEAPHQDATLHVYSGAELIAIRELDWTRESLAAVKRLCRYSLEHFTQGKPLKTRYVYQALKTLT